MSFGKGGPKEQVVTNSLDPKQQAWNDYVHQQAKNVAGQAYTPYNKQLVAGPYQASSDALNAMGGMPGVFGGIANGIGGPNIGPYSRAGSVAANALGGDRNAVNALMDPYQKNVIDALGGQYDQLRGKATMATNDEATRAGAMGGDRAALLTGARLGEIDRGQASDIANLLSSGYNSAMDRAAGTAGLGLNAQNMAGQFGLGLGNLRLGAAQGQLGALGQQFGMGDYMRGINQAGLDAAHNQFLEQRGWGEHQLGVLSGAGQGLPYGTTQTQPLYNNKFGSVAGGAATGFGIGGPIGAGIGGLGGLLFG